MSNTNQALDQVVSLIDANPGLLAALVELKMPSISGTLTGMGFSVRDAAQDETFIAQRIQERLPAGIVEQITKSVEDSIRNAREPRFKTWKEIHTHLQEKGLTPGSLQYLQELQSTAEECQLLGKVDQEDIDSLAEKTAETRKRVHFFGALAR